MLPPQPLDVSDFSGGITENILQGDPRRYEKADNLLVTADKKLIERDGTVPFSTDGWNLFGTAAGTQRVNSFFDFLNNTQLIPNSGRSLFVNQPGQTSWTEITGISSHPVLHGGDETSQVSFAEYVKTVYLTSDGPVNSYGIQPSKIFRDTTNAWITRTSGLPRAYVQSAYTDATLLAKCINLANALRTSMVSHFSDAISASYVWPGLYDESNLALHLNADQYSLSYFSTQSFTATTGTCPQPTVIPTPQPACTDQASLFLLVQALNLAYTYHATVDALKIDSFAGLGDNTPNFHQNPWVNLNIMAQPGCRKGPGVVLTDNSLPTTVKQTASQLDDLLVKWNWHRKAVNVHSPQNDPVQFDKYAPIETAVGRVQIGNTWPVITPDWTDIINYANNLKYIYNRHVQNNSGSLGSHKMRSNNASFVVSSDYYSMRLECTLPDATTLPDAFLMIYWLRCLYDMHNQDAASLVWVNVQFDATSGSPNLTSVIRTDTGAAYTMPAEAFLEIGLSGTSRFAAQLNQYDQGGQYRVAYVTSSGAGTAVLDRNVNTTATLTGQVAIAEFHSSRSSDGSAFTNSPTSTPELAGSTLATSCLVPGTSTATWLTLAAELLSTFKTHALNQRVHTGGALTSSQQQSKWNNGIKGVPYPDFLQPNFASSSYAFYFTHTYTVEPNGVQYLVRSNPILSDATDIAISYPVGYQPPNQSFGYNKTNSITSTRANVLSSLPVLVNDSVTNYAVSDIKLQIYKTTNAGTTYFKLAEVANGTTSYTDVTNDTIGTTGSPALSSNASLYTSGGVLGDDQPPICKFIHMFEESAYYGAITDSGQFFANRVLQSKPNAPDAAPAANFIDLPDVLTGLTSSRSNLVALCKKSAYRISGGFSTTGQGNLTYDKISDEIGGLNQKSIVQTEIGVFFAATDGFYYTDGFQLIKISLELDKTYAGLTASDSQKRCIYGAYDRLNRRIWWSMRSQPTSAENDIYYIFHINYGVKPSAVFTTALNFGVLQTSSMVFRNGVQYIGHAYGAILKSDFRYMSDINIQFSSNVLTQSEPAYIPFLFRCIAIDMGTTFNRKWITKVHLVGQNRGDICADVKMIRDLNQTKAGPKLMAPINYAPNPRWGNPTCLWGDATQVWDYQGKMDLWRRFPATTLRSDFMQLELAPRFGAIYASSDGFPDGANVVVDATAKTATIQTPTGYSAIVFPPDCVNYYLKLAYDSYATQYLITATNSSTFPTVLTVTDPSATLLSAPSGVAWEIWGYKKQQRFSLSSFVLHYALLGNENQQYPGTATTSGPGNAGQNT